MRKLKNPFNVKKSYPRMSWNPQNLFNLHQRTYGPESKETNFSRSSKSVFWQKWKSKAVTRAYHGDWIQEKKFKRHYLPSSLPTLAIKSSQKGNRYGNRDEKVPLAALMYQELERRLDVAIFRSCFADSVYEARRIIIHGAVRLNGVKCDAPWTRLHPGDMFTVNPIAIPMLNPGKTWPENLGDPYVVDQDKKKKTTTKEKDSNSPAAANADTNAQVPSVVNLTKAETPTDISENLTQTSNQVAPEADEDTPTNTSESDQSSDSKTSLKRSHLTFTLPTYASPFIFIPPYLEVSFRLCSSVYLRHPTSGPGYCEIPTPWDADGEVMKLAWEWYTKQGLGRRIRKERKEWDALKEMKRDPFAEGHLRKNSIGGRVAVHGKYQGGRVGAAPLGSGEPRLSPIK